MGRYYEIVTDRLGLDDIPVQYVGVYVLNWGKRAEPEVGFFGSSIGDFEQGWRNAAQVLKRQRDEAQAQCKDLLGAVSFYQLHTDHVPETVARNIAKAKLEVTEYLLPFITEAG